MRNLFTNPKRIPLIAPSILSADFGHMADDCRAVLEADADSDGGGGGSADLLHLDVMDGHFVPNLTMGPDMCKGLRRALPRAFLDVHLMVTEPWPHARAFAEAGADHITFHAEVLSDGAIPAMAARIRELGVTVGLAINPATPADRVLSHLENFDLVLVMSVNPGFSGQKFIAEVLDKTRAIADDLLPTQRLEMDGGINESNAATVRDAGCDVLVAASAIFGLPSGPKRAAAIRSLRGK